MSAWFMVSLVTSLHLMYTTVMDGIAKIGRMNATVGLLFMILVFS